MGAITERGGLAKGEKSLMVAGWEKCWKGRHAVTKNKERKSRRLPIWLPSVREDKKALQRRRRKGSETAPKTQSTRGRVKWG